jgi:hypothetical protein
VIPAFTNTELKRVTKGGTYFFLNVQISEVPDVEEGLPPLLVVHGKLVNDTLLTSDQFYSSETGLVKKAQSMPSAPTSFFVLILNSHKLLYAPEVEDAPSLGAFGATLQKFLGIQYRAYVDVLYEESKAGADPKTKKRIYHEIPHPNVEILPLASKASIEQFLQAFAKLKHLEFRILDTNAEYQQKETFEQIRAMRKAIDAKVTKLVHDNAAGLDKKDAVEQIHAAAASGNQRVHLSGESTTGDRLRGNNEHFSLSIADEGPPQDDIERAIHMVRTYQDYVLRGIISEDVAADNADKMRRLREKRNRNA